MVQVSQILPFRCSSQSIYLYIEMNLFNLQGPCKKNGDMSPSPIHHRSLSTVRYLNSFSCSLGLEKETSFILKCLDNPQYCHPSVCHPPIHSPHGSLQLSVPRQTLDGQPVSIETAVTTDHYFQSLNSSLLLQDKLKRV